MRTKLVGALTVGLLALGACSDGDDKNALTDTSQAGGQTTETLKGLDSGFGQDGVLASPLSAADHDRLLAVTNGPGGSFYAAGWTSPGGDNAMVLAKLGSDGKLDPAFGQGGMATVNVAVGGRSVEVARAVAVQPDGKILIAGPFEKDPKATRLRGEGHRHRRPALRRHRTARSQLRQGRYGQNRHRPREAPQRRQLRRRQLLGHGRPGRRAGGLLRLDPLPRPGGRRLRSRRADGRRGRSIPPSARKGVTRIDLDHGQRTVPGPWPCSPTASWSSPATAATPTTS